MKRAFMVVLAWLVAIVMMAVAGPASGQAGANKPVAAATAKASVTAQRSASTADPKVPPTIKVSVSKSFFVTITAPSSCKMFDGRREIPSKVSGAADSEGGSALNLLLAYGASCQGTSKAVMPEVDIETDAIYPYAVQPGEYKWLFSSWGWVNRLMSTIGVVDKCVAQEADKPAKKDDDNCRPLRVGQGYVFQLTTPFEKGEIVATYNASKDPKKADNRQIKLQVYPCEFEALGAVSGIVAGAAEQILELRQTGTQGTCFLPDGAGTLTNATGTRSINVTSLGDAESPNQLRLTDIPADLDRGIQSFKLRMAGGLLAVVRAPVIPPVTVTKLSVRYQVKKELDVYGHFAAASGDAATGDAASNSSGERYAVVSSRIDDRDAVVNIATLSWSPQLPSPVSDCAPEREFRAKLERIAQIDRQKTKLEKDISSIEEEGLEKKLSVELRDMREQTSKLYEERDALVGSDLSSFVWKVDRLGEDGFRPLVVDPDAGVCLGQESDDAAQEDAETRPSHDLHQLPFVVEKPISGPVNVALVLRHTQKIAWQERASATRNVLRIVVSLASKARTESLPLPIRDFLEVRCSGEVPFWNGEVHAIKELAVKEGECIVQPIDWGTSGGALTARAQTFQKLLPLYGPQTLNVLVRRGGVEWKQLWKFAPFKGTAQVKGEWPRTVTLQEPQADSKTDAYYVVEVKPIATQNIDVKYRNSTLASISDATFATPGELTFSARLRTRGAFGIHCSSGKRADDYSYSEMPCIRAYLSATVFAAGLRMPASNVDLRTSTSNRHIQFVTPVVGLLGTIEPWSYDRGENWWALNPVFQFGGHFYSLGEDEIAFNPVVGLALTLPLVKENTPAGSQLGTQATLGAFFEWDTRESAPHALLGLSVNVGSLLSGK